MRKTFLIALCVVFAMSSAAMAKNTQGSLADYKFMEIPNEPISQSDAEGMFKAAAATTTTLGWWQFDTASGQPTDQGWVSADITAQAATFFHVSGPGCPMEQPTAINGTKSMWCGKWPTTADPYCGWATLPGYGNGWDQSLVAQNNHTTLQYDIVWDSEPGYDETTVEELIAGVWTVIGTVNGGAGLYDGNGGPITESVTATAGATQFRFHFTADGAWSDEDGLWPTNEGAVKVDDLILDAGTVGEVEENWEGEVCGAVQSDDAVWRAETPPPFGDYSGLT
ncbi:MAG: hypothetical protein JSW50_05895, partial [Candidatus Latescibacterota bacterium]